MSDMSENVTARGVEVAKLISERNALQGKLRDLSTKLEEKQITVEEFRVLKEDYKERIEELQKEIDRLCGIREVYREKIVAPPTAPPRTPSVEYRAEQKQIQAPVVKVEQKQSTGLGTCALVCLVIFIIIVVVLWVLGINIMDFISSLFRGFGF